LVKFVLFKKRTKNISSARPLFCVEVEPEASFCVFVLYQNSGPILLIFFLLLRSRTSLSSLDRLIRFLGTTSPGPASRVFGETGSYEVQLQVLTLLIIAIMMTYADQLSSLLTLGAALGQLRRIGYVRGKIKTKLFV
jgi:hypothetical protein